MAADGIALLDHLKVEKAHVVGASMGGMLAQTMAIEYPHRVASMTSMMSTTGSSKVVEPSLSMKLFLAEKPKSNSLEHVAQRSVDFWRVVGGPRKFDMSVCYSKSYYIASRSQYVAGAFRHAGAVVYSPCRLEGLKKLAMPCLVIHGERDELVPTPNGVQTHQAIPGSRLVLIPEMGHIIYPEDNALVVSEIDAVARRSGVAVAALNTREPKP
jgi:pimeloyl-ACP methyl ester carboxylesterase